MPLKQVDPVTGRIREIGNVREAADWLRLHAPDLPIERATRGQRPVNRLVDIIDDEVEVNRCPMTPEVTSDRAVRSSREGTEPEGPSI